MKSSRRKFIEPLRISAYKLAKDIFVPISRVQDILHGRRCITEDMSLRLSKHSGVSERNFVSLQDDIDLRNEKIALAEELDKIQVAMA